MNSDSRFVSSAGIYIASAILLLMLTKIKMLQVRNLKILEFPYSVASFLFKKTSVFHNSFVFFLFQIGHVFLHIKSHS